MRCCTESNFALRNDLLLIKLNVRGFIVCLCDCLSTGVLLRFFQGNVTENL